MNIYIYIFFMKENKRIKYNNVNFSLSIYFASTNVILTFFFFIIDSQIRTSKRPYRVHTYSFFFFFIITRKKYSVYEKHCCRWIIGITMKQRENITKWLKRSLPLMTLLRLIKKKKKQNKNVFHSMRSFIFILVMKKKTSWGLTDHKILRELHASIPNPLFKYPIIRISNLLLWKVDDSVVCASALHTVNN